MYSDTGYVKWGFSWSFSTMEKHFSESGAVTVFLSPTEIKASGGLQECADEDVSEADAHSAARTLGRS